MSKGVKISIAITIIMLLLFAILFVTYDSFKPQPVNTNNILQNTSKDSNTGLDNVINELFENVETNAQNKIENVENRQEANHEVEEDNTVENEQTEILNGTVSSKEERAVELVKEEWGSTSGVYFSNMGIDSKGRYIVTVNNSKTTQSLAFYVVDVENEIVTKK